MPGYRKAYSNPALVSALLGSKGFVSESVKLSPSPTGPSFSNPAVGATLFTIRSNVASAVPPLPIMILLKVLPNEVIEFVPFEITVEPVLVKLLFAGTDGGGRLVGREDPVAALQQAE